MNTIKLFIYLLALTIVFNACEMKGDADFDNSNGQNYKEPKLEAEIFYGGKSFTFNLSGEELPDKVVFLSNQMYFKATNDLNQVINIKLAAPDLYSSSEDVFRAIPNLPYSIEDKLAIIQFYAATEQPLTNAATKYAVDDEVVVSEFTENKIVLAYDGNAITGAQLNKYDEEQFNLKLELTYTNFQLTDMR